MFGRLPCSAASQPAICSGDQSSWSFAATILDRHLTIRALDMALRRRCPGAGLLHHSDQGSTYASEDYQAVLAAHGITCSMSRRGNCYDNAAMESWVSTLKSELGERFETAGHAKDQLFDYIEVFSRRRALMQPPQRWRDEAVVTAG